MQQQLAVLSSTAKTKKKKRVTLVNPRPSHHGDPAAATGGNTADTDAAGIGGPP